MTTYPVNLYRELKNDVFYMNINMNMNHVYISWTTEIINNKNIT